MFYAPFSLPVSISVVGRKSTRRSIWHQKGIPEEADYRCYQEGEGNKIQQWHVSQTSGILL